MYGAAAPFAQQLLNSITAGSALPPDDWMTIAKACLDPGDYLLWKTGYTEICKEQATRSTAHGIPITAHLLLGQGDHTGLQNQLNYPPLTCDQKGIAATRVCKKLPTKGDKTKKLLQFFKVLESLFKTLWLAYYTIWVELLGTLNWVLSL
jgi:hypothetical protein